jgi:hypothetical protein
MRVPSIYRPDSTIEGVSPQDIIDACIENRHIGSREITRRNLDLGFLLGSTFYVDGINGLDTNDGLTGATAFKTIQKAVDSCGNGAGDTIYVAPMASAKYTENVVIYQHQSIKIIAPYGPWTTRMRPSDATTKYPFTPSGGVAVAGAAFIVLSRDVEICGFNIDTGGGYAGIYVGDGTAVTGLGYTNQNSAGYYFHDNEFQSGNDGFYGIVCQGSSDNGIIANNVFNWFATTGAGIHMCCGGARTNQRIRIINNDFLGCLDYGIYLTNDVHYNTLVKGNTFFDRLPGTTVMIQSCLFQGGYGNAFVGNFDATTNGALGDATDFMSGNTELHAMNVPVYIAEA